MVKGNALTASDNHAPGVLLSKGFSDENIVYPTLIFVKYNYEISRKALSVSNILSRSNIGF